MLNPGRAFLTQDLDPIAGLIKQEPADFEVEEIPSKLPRGQGPDCHLWVEKEGLSTFSVVEHLAQFSSRQEEEFGFAGLKDSQAVTRQWISVTGSCPEDWKDFEHSQIRILIAEKHTGPLRVGDLLGNRFRIRIRQARNRDLSRARKVMGVLLRRGVPNFFGPQRFGWEGQGPELGKALLAGDYSRFGRLVRSLEQPQHADLARLTRPFQSGIDFREAVFRIPPRLRKLIVSAFQARLFNQLLNRRLENMDHILPGDLVWCHAEHRILARSETRDPGHHLATKEWSPSGPLFGPEMPMAGGVPGRWETEILDHAGLENEAFLRGAQEHGLRGSRRPLRVPLTEARLDYWEDSFFLSFRLPKGAYATVVVEEILKREFGLHRCNTPAGNVEKNERNRSRSTFPSRGQGL